MKKIKNNKTYRIILLLFVLIIMILLIRNINSNKKKDIIQEYEIGQSQLSTEEDLESNTSTSKEIGNKNSRTSETNKKVNEENVEDSINDSNKDIDQGLVFNGELEFLDASLVKNQLEGLDNNVNVDFLLSLENLEKATYNYLLTMDVFDKNTSETEVINLVNNGLMSILRKDRYSDAGIGMNAVFWHTVAGETEASIVAVLKLLEDDLEASMANVDSYVLINNNEVSDREITEIYNLMKAIHDMDYSNEFIDPKTGDVIDFIHMIASLDSIYSEVGMDEEIEEFVDYLAGWAGDLKTFFPDLLKAIDSGELHNPKEYKAYVKSTLGTSEKSYFSAEDLLADLDAVNINTVLKSGNLLLSEAIIWYYNSRATDLRYTNFVKSFGSEEEFKHIVYLMLYYQSIDESDIEAYEFSLNDLVGLLELFEDVFKHRETSNEEIDALYEGYTEIIIHNMEIEIQNY